MKQPGEEQLGMGVTFDKLITPADREFAPGLLDCLSSVRLSNEPHYRDRVPIDRLECAALELPADARSCIRFLPSFEALMM